MKKIITTLFAALLLVCSVQAQKFGYVNSQALLLSMNEIKTADTELMAYQNELITSGEQMVKEFEASYQAYLKKANEGSLSQVQAASEEQALAKSQQDIQAYEVEVQNLLGARKQKLYEPILQKVQDAVTKLGKDESYTFIFDLAGGGILYSLEAEDVTAKLKVILGVN